MRAHTEYDYLLVHPEEQIISHDAADVSAQGVPDAGRSRDRETEVSQDRQSIGKTFRYGSQIFHRGRITRWQGQCAPVDQEYVVAAVLQVSVAQNRDRQSIVATCECKTRCENCVKPQSHLKGS